MALEVALNSCFISTRRVDKGVVSLQGLVLSPRVVS